MINNLNILIQPIDLNSEKGQKKIPSLIKKKPQRKSNKGIEDVQRTYSDEIEKLLKYAMDRFIYIRKKDQL